MNLLEDPWIPVRANGGTGAFRLLPYRELLCEPDETWQISLPRDDLELACLQLLVCLTQVMFLPEDDQMLRARIAKPLSVTEFDSGTVPCWDWFDLDHPTQPFMQSRGVKGEWTSMQKLLPGLPEKSSKSPTAHCFFNEVSEVEHLCGSLAAIALFNQASNCPSFGGGFKGSLRGGAPITTLVLGCGLRDMVWRNVLTRPRVALRQISMSTWAEEPPTWVRPIVEKSIVPWDEIGLIRGLFWQPARVELVKSVSNEPCDVLGGEPGATYSGFRKEKFNFTVHGVWPHPHGTLSVTKKNGLLEQRFTSFTTTAPAWTHLSEFVVPRSLDDANVKEGVVPAGPITQFGEMGGSSLNLLIGGYRTKQASVLERRHELVSLARGWRDDKERLPELVGIGNDAKKALRGKLFFAVQGNKDKGLKGIGAAIHETAEKLFYARTENLIHETFSNEYTWKTWAPARRDFAGKMARHCRDIFEELTAPYAMKPELIPVIAWARRSMTTDLKKLTEEA